MTTSLATTHLSFTQAMARDMLNNQVTAGPSSAAVQAVRFVSDAARPTLERFYLDLNLGQLRFFFSEVMSTSTVTYGALTLQDAAVAPTAAFTLRGGTLQSTPVLVEYTVNMTAADMDAIKGLTSIGSSVNTTFLVMQREAFVDKAGPTGCCSHIACNAGLGSH